MENAPNWLPNLILIAGSGGILWTVWSKFGEAVKGFVGIKNDLKTSSLENKLQEIDVMKKYEVFFEGRLHKVLEEVKRIEEEFSDYKKRTALNRESDRKLITSFTERDRKQVSYILYTDSLLKSNNIKFKPYDYNE